MERNMTAQEVLKWLFDHYADRKETYTEVFGSDYTFIRLIAALGVDEVVKRIQEYEDSQKKEPVVMAVWKCEALYKDRLRKVAKFTSENEANQWCYDRAKEGATAYKVWYCELVEQ